MVEWNLERWTTLVAEGQPVGVCPQAGCGGQQFGEPLIEVRGRVFLDARCAACGHETSAPGGRTSDVVVVPFRQRIVRPRERPRDHAERAAGE